MGVSSNITTEKPKALEVIPGNVPAHIKEIPRWVCWRYEFLNGKWIKPPINPKTGVIASINDAKAFAAFEEVDLSNKYEILKIF